ncbi:LOW QUALITY PROTEIN: hypothetical protein V1477_017289 [Vespula maculifrons]|uniref:Uncharacterized protein n=1 Tax=Vespula maculifrons TaxID=7453 RepID=A0ABD2B5V1_VESMC
MSKCWMMNSEGNRDRQRRERQVERKNELRSSSSVVQMNIGRKPIFSMKKVIISFIPTVQYFHFGTLEWKHLNPLLIILYGKIDKSLLRKRKTKGKSKEIGRKICLMVVSMFRFDGEPKDRKYKKESRFGILYDKTVHELWNGNELFREETPKELEPARSRCLENKSVRMHIRYQCSYKDFSSKRKTNDDDDDDVDDDGDDYDKAVTLIDLDVEIDLDNVTSNRFEEQYTQPSLYAE